MIYLIASRLNAQEYLIISSQSPYGVFRFDTLDQAKKIFEPFYNIMSTEDINSDVYQKTLLHLVDTYPVIIGLNGDINEVLSKIPQWQDAEKTYTPGLPIIPLPHRIAAMKKGFIDTYQVLDIIRDIESIKRIDSEGRIENIIFDIDRLENGNENGSKTTIELLTEEETRELLRKKGLM